MDTTPVATAGPAVIQVRERGQFTIPATIRRGMDIKEGDTFSLLQVGDALIATRKRLVAQEIARTIESIMQEHNVTLDDLLAGLDEQRARYVRERYGLPA